jgi:nicotinamidase-related amidase
MIKKQNPIMVGQPVLIVVDIQGASMDGQEAGIAIMPGMGERMLRSRTVIDAARANGVPVIFLQEIHRRTMVDFGRELDGDEGVHLLEDWPNTAIAADVVGLLPEDYVIQKRRYSGFIGTDLDILLRGLKAETLYLIGGLTNVCVHYTFADAHQSDYHVRVVEDCVGGSSVDAHDAALIAMEYLQHGARRSATEIIAAFDNFGGAAKTKVA